jgi:hypothetical protein
VAINLWKLGGKPTSYNPLPIGYGNIVAVLGIGDYTIRFKAKSVSGGKLELFDESPYDFYKSITLTNTLSSYEFTFTSKSKQQFTIKDETDKGDIIIEDIQLVQKPLPKLTINGIDGFSSGKWNLHANARVLDDETLELNATATAQVSSLTFAVTPNTAYTFSQLTGKTVTIRKSDDTVTYFNNEYISPIVFTTDSNTKEIIVKLHNGATANGKFTFKKPMLNLGTTPAPHSKKTGEKMVLPKKPKRYVPKKNLISVIEQGNVSSSDLSDQANAFRVRAKDTFKAKDISYTVSCLETNRQVYVWYRTNSGSMGSSGAWMNMPYTFSFANMKEFRLQFRKPDETGIFPNEVTVQLEEGTTATPYEPYQLILPRAKTGQAFNGTTDYLQLPSMTMDSIEIECLIDSVQGSGWKLFVDNNSSSPNYYYGVNAPTAEIVRSGFVSIGDAFRYNERIKLNLKLNSSISDGFTIFSASDGGGKVKGTLYKITPYLNGQPLVTYDLENPSNIIGDKVIPNAKNLIPSFEDARWSLHANFKVLGKDVGRFEATSGTSLTTILYNIPVTEGRTYLFPTQGNGRIRIARGDNNGYIADSWNTVNKSFVVPSGLTSINFQLDNNASAGTFDFIKPQLYELPTTTATLFGKPSPLRKASKRSLYEKR